MSDTLSASLLGNLVYRGNGAAPCRYKPLMPEATT